MTQQQAPNNGSITSGDTSSEIDSGPKCFHECGRIKLGDGSGTADSCDCSCCRWFISCTSLDAPPKFATKAKHRKWFSRKTISPHSTRLRGDYNCFRTSTEYVRELRILSASSQDKTESVVEDDGNPSEEAERKRCGIAPNSSEVHLLGGLVALDNSFDEMDNVGQD